MKKLAVIAIVVSLALALAWVSVHGAGGAPGWTLVGWNNLGMHCMDVDYSIFSILPPYNTIHAQLVDNAGRLVTNSSGITVTYQGVADAGGSINRTSAGKTNFWQFVLPLFGAAIPPDAGLAGHGMPGSANVPQPMVFDPANGWWIAEGIPLTPYDDAGLKNAYPMMRLVAKSGTGAVLATTDIVLPVSDEMDCRACHGSGTVAAAEPSAGWVNDPDPVRDYRLNILRLHDDRQGGTPAYQAALSTVGLNAGGLYPTVTADHRPILCAACHASVALGAPGIAGIPPLTASAHALHGNVVDPTNGLTLNASANRSACYRCHPGSTTKCLRGAMGRAVAPDGTMAMQCQSCHGPMVAVGSPNRTGWLNEPACQNCHTGTAVANSGAIRFMTALDATGTPRVPADNTFATNANTPAAGLSLFRFSRGHGGLACEACHGSTHAEFETSHDSDNVQSIQIQGHAGPMAECAACHVTSPSTVTGGPHGMHPVGQVWVDQHNQAAGDNGANAAQCRACHGTDYRGTVLSYTQGDRSLSTRFGAKTFWRGFQVGCYACHYGPFNDNPNPNHPPVANGDSVSVPSGQPTAIGLRATDPDGNALTLRIVSQSAHGTVGLGGTTATYFPDVGYTGGDAFTFSAWDGSTDSNLAELALTVGAAVTPPSIASVGRASNPYRIKIAGSNFQAAAQVFIGSDTTPWGNLTVKSAGQIVLKQGSALKARFPVGTAIAIRVRNPDGGEATTVYTRP